ncbi:porin [Burkholderia sp. Bp9012]|uniref:porin n=1 Tax=Burkholderia sp. Bp9012 TaxID=2184562 RepID=UPI002892AF2D|nr:porin [Burkholderia sp. Bp9012]
MPARQRCLPRFVCLQGIAQLFPHLGKSRPLRAVTLIFFVHARQYHPSSSKTTWRLVVTRHAFVVIAIGSALSGTALAQSSVQIYGIMDTAVTYVNNAGGASVTGLSAGPLKGNRVGLLGKEDLGGGMRAIFRLENGFSALNGALGQGGAMFGRQAYVGLASPYGTITAGRQYDSIVDYVGVLKAGGDTAGAYANHPGDLDNTGNNFRVNNAIKYTSPTVRGVTFGGVFSPGGVAGDFRRKRVFSLGAGYSNGPLQLGAAYLNAQDPNFSFFGTNPSSSVTGNNMTAAPIYSGYASARTLQIAGATGAYTFGGWTAGVVYTNTQLRDLGAEAGLNPHGYSGSAVFNTWELNLRKTWAATTMFGTSVQYTRASHVTGNASSAGYLQANAGVDYFLSKRTDLYLVGIWQHATGHDSTGGNAVASIYGFTASTTANQLAVALGMRHSF